MMMVMMNFFLCMVVNTSNKSTDVSLSISEVSLFIVSIRLMDESIIGTVMSFIIMNSCGFCSLSCLSLLSFVGIIGLFLLRSRYSVISRFICLHSCVLLNMVIHAANFSTDMSLSISEESLFIISIWLMDKTVMDTVVISIIFSFCGFSCICSSSFSSFNDIGCLLFLTSRYSFI